MIKLLWGFDKKRVLFELLYQAQGYAYWVFYDIVFIRFLVGAMESGRSFGQIMGFILLSMIGFTLPSAFAQWYEHAYLLKSNADIFEHFARYRGGFNYGI